MILRCLSAAPHHVVKEVESTYKNILHWGHGFLPLPWPLLRQYVHHGLLLVVRENIAWGGGVAWERKREARCIKGSFIARPAPMPLLRILMGPMG